LELVTQKDMVRRFKGVSVNQEKIDKMMQDIEEANADVQFISIPPPEQFVEKSFPEWLWDCIVKFIWLR
jgi:hypothetical protein